MGVIDKVEVIAWADGLVASRDRVPEWLLDVSLAANQDKWAIEAKLRDVPGERNPLVSAYAAIQRFGKEFEANGKFTSKEAAHMLVIWAASAKVGQDHWVRAMMPSWIADDLASGYTTDQQVVESIHDCIAHFAAIGAG